MIKEEKFYRHFYCLPKNKYKTLGEDARKIIKLLKAFSATYPKPVKPSTEIRKLKEEVKNLRNVCKMAGIPLLIIYFPELVKAGKLNKADKKWALEKIKEHKALKNKRQKP